MADRIGQELGNYRLVSLLGRGGFAEVYLGEHMRLKTKTAIKVLYTQLEGDDTEYFLTEAQTVAHLVHPHIVRIFDFDVKEGVPFLVMDYAPNGNLRQRHPKNTRIPLETIVSYIKQVADALQYAHDGKLIHRDIKPENMLLGRRNEVLLSDFGIALIAQSTRMQSTQEVVGTAYYMAPEQLQGKPRLASDQYALGVVVYEWLSGSRPFHGSFSEIASQHMFVPPKPLREKIPMISPVVEEVVMTALAKDPHQRFGSVQAFANALEQASQSTRTPSTITPPSQPLVQPGSATSPSQPLIQTGQQPIILQSGPITSPGQSGPQPITPPPVSRPRPPVRKQAEVASSNTNPSSQAPVAPPRQSAARPNSAMPLNRPASQHGPSTPPRPSVSRSSPPRKATTIRPSKRGISRRAVLIGLAGIVVAGGGITWFVLSQKPPVGTILYTYRGHSNTVNGVAWSPDGKLMASASTDGTVQVWDATTGSKSITYTGHSNIVNALAWSPDGQRIASAGDDKTVQISNATTGTNVVTFSGHPAIVNAVIWSPNGNLIASGSADETVRVWDASSGNGILSYANHSDWVRSVTWSPNGQQIASGSDDKTVQVWNAATAESLVTYRNHSSGVNAVAWSPDGQHIASGSSDQTVQVWDANTASSVFTYNGHSNIVYAIAWSPDGRRIASGSDDGTVQVWDASNGGNVFAYHGHSSGVHGVAWSPDGQHIASAGYDQTVQVWQAS